MLNTPTTENRTPRGDGSLADRNRADITVILTPQTQPALWAQMNLGEDAPEQLWARGDVSMLLERPAVTITGSRAATAYGMTIAAELAADLATTHTIVTGAAYGIDGAAVRATIAAGGAAAVFLAGGLDRPYPAGHIDLIDRVASTGGVLLSEFAPEEAPTRWRFMRRNRLIAAAARGAVIVEAGARSGALNVAAIADTLEIPVGAVPGPATSAASTGCHRLIREHGAQLLTCAADVREMLR